MANKAPTTSAVAEPTNGNADTNNSAINRNCFGRSAITTVL